MNFTDLLEWNGDDLNDSLVDLLSGGVLGVNPSEGLILFASRGFTNLTGYSREELYGFQEEESYSRLVCEEDQVWVKDKFIQQMSEGQKAEMEYRLIKKDGSLIWVKFCAVLMHRKKIGPCYACVYLDITEAKTALKSAEFAREEIRQLVNNFPGGVAHMKLQNGVIVEYASEGYYRLVGYSREELKEKFGGDCGRLIYLKDRDWVLEQMDDFFYSDLKDIVIEYRILNKFNKICWVRANMGKIIGSDGKTAALECVFTDISASKLTEQQLQFNLERYRIICEQTEEIVFDWDVETGSIYHSPVFRKKFGYSIPTINTMTFLLNSDVIFEEDIKRFQEILKSLKEGSPYMEDEYRIKKLSGEYIWCKIRVTAMFNEQKLVYRAVGFISDIEEYKRETAFLQEKAERDLLTGLLNKITTQDFIEADLSRVSEKGRKAAFFLVDIDNFKRINDYLGHLTGDEVLRSIAEGLSQQFRAGETVGRIGGDEFVIYLRSEADREELCRIAMKIQENFRKSIKGKPQTFKTTGSIGIALYPDHGRSFQELYERADAALYMAKHRGKDCYAFYTKTVMEELYDEAT